MDTDQSKALSGLHNMDTNQGAASSGPNTVDTNQGTTHSSPPAMEQAAKILESALVSLNALRRMRMWHLQRQRDRSPLTHRSFARQAQWSPERMRTWRLQQGKLDSVASTLGTVLPLVAGRRGPQGQAGPRMHPVRTAGVVEDMRELLRPAKGTRRS